MMAALVVALEHIMPDGTLGFGALIVPNLRVQVRRFSSLDRPLCTARPPEQPLQR